MDDLDGARTLDGSFSGASADWEPTDMGLELPIGMRVLHLPPGAAELSHCANRHVIDLHGDMSRGKLAIDGAKPSAHRLAANSVGFIPAGCEMRMDLVNTHPSRVLFVEPALLATITDCDGLPSSREIAPLLWRQDRLVTAYARAFDQLAVDDISVDELEIETAALAICARVVELAQERHGRASSHVRHNNRCALALDYIESNLDSALRISDIADAANMAPFHFLRAFKAAMGETPHRLIQRRRIETACDLLKQTRLPIVDIAAQVGFASQSHMTTAMQRLLRVTPARYRAAVH